MTIVHDSNNCDCLKPRAYELLWAPNYTISYTVPVDDGVLGSFGVDNLDELDGVDGVAARGLVVEAGGCHMAML